MDSPPVLFEIDSELGESYVAAMELAGEYAYAGRDVVVAKVLEILGAEAMHEVHNHHNFAWREEHFGRTYWVIRKGCTPARPGQEGFVGGSMGDESVILEGVESPGAAESLYSTVHGAGRVMSRTQAAGRVRRRKRWACRNRDCDRIFETTHRVRTTRTRASGRSGSRSSSSPAWSTGRRSRRGCASRASCSSAAARTRRRRCTSACRTSSPPTRGSIRVKHTLRPLGVAMAGRDVHDPYKD